MEPPTPIRVALDWTPNTIHTGLYTALSRGLYASANLAVTLHPPSPTYDLTPAKHLERRTADLAICPSESCIAYAESGAMHLQAIYAILQQDASAVVSRRFSRVAELGDQEGVYGSYNARYEDQIVRAMVEGDGGHGGGMRVRGEEGRLGLFGALRMGEVDATWVFMPWEGVEAEMEGEKLNEFKMEECGVPYGYSPVIARDAGVGKGLSDEVLRRFVKATREGYELAMREMKEAAALLAEHCDPPRSIEFLERSQERINEFYGGEGPLGFMQARKWEDWVGWLKAQRLVKAEQVDPTKMFTNEFFADE